MSIPDPSLPTRLLSPFGTLCGDGTYAPHFLFLIYKLIYAPPEGFTPPSILKWESELQVTLTNAQIIRAITLANKPSIVNHYQKQGCRLLS